MIQAIHCPKCHKEIELQIEEDDHFCPACGQHIVIERQKIEPKKTEPQSEEKEKDRRSLPDGEKEFLKDERPNSKLIPCKDCGQNISRNALFCPKCGCPNELEVKKQEKKNADFRENLQGCGCFLVAGGLLFTVLLPDVGLPAVFIGICALIVGWLMPK